MITKMKKLTFLIYHKDYECFLQSVRDLGVVHVAEKAQGTAENAELQESIRLSDRYASTIKFLQGFNAELQEQEGDVARGEKGLEEVEALQLEKTQLQHQLQVCDKERAALEVWGDFDPASVMRLQEVGYQVNFYICSEKNFNEEWLDTYYATEINRIGSRIYFITITKEGSLPELEVESVKLPVMSLSRLAARCESLEQQMKSVDGRFYLYYSMAHSSRMSVAVCNTPAGHYEYYGDVKTSDGRIYGIDKGDMLQFDPGVFADDDGRVYLYSGFCPNKTEDEHGRIMAGAHVCRLSDDMITMKDLPHVIFPRDFKCPEEAGFFEASSMRKFGRKYYFIYSARANGLHYCISDYPDRDFVYGGRLHASSDVGLRGYTPSDTAYPNGNTHGSIIQLNESFYIFDHRFTNACSYCRQGVAEKIEMDENGFFKAAEATSCGLNGGPLDGEGTYPSYIVCFLKNIKLEKDASKEERLSKNAYVTQDGGDRESGEDAYIANMQDGCIAGFKYFNMKKGHNKIAISVRGNAVGTIKITTDSDYSGKNIEDYPIAGQALLSIESHDWKETVVDIDIETGINPVYFIFEGRGKFDIKNFTII